MFGRLSTLASLSALCTAYFVVGCGGGDLDVYNNGKDAGGSTGGPSRDAGNNGVDDAGAPDTSTPEHPDPSDAATPPEDMGSPGMPDLPTLDMGMPEPVDPTTNTPQSGPTVDEQILSQCSTIAVKGLSLQLIDQMNCEDPGVMKSFEGDANFTYGAVVFPFQQGPATDALKAAAASRAGAMPISSALRTLPQQFLLYEWYQRGLCNANLAAAPGRSNHNGGLAVDIGDSSTWRTSMRNRSYIDNVSGEPWHFYFSGAGGKDVRNLSVLAFQKLYNRNFPENAISEDGLYGPQTEGALKRSPANGFTLPPRCDASMLMVAYPNKAPLEVSWERIAEGVVGIRTIAPTGIRLVEYFVEGRLVGFSDQAGGALFETVLDLPPIVEAGAKLEVVAYDAWGVEKGRAVGSIDGWTHEPAVFVRPLGGDNYEIGLEDLPPGVHAVEFYVDGVPTEQDPLYRIASPEAKRLATNLRGQHSIDVVLLDKRDRVVKILTRDLASPQE